MTLMPTWDLEPEPEQAAVHDPALLDVSASATNRTVPAGRFFDLEYIGSIVRIRCRTCDKHEQLPDDSKDAVEAAKATHRCGTKTSVLDRNDVGGPA
jgi:hypothetical protein